jgi:hypothetical protein
VNYRIVVHPVERRDVLAAAAVAGWPKLVTPNGECLEGEPRWRAAHLGYASERRTLLEQLRAMVQGDDVAR